MSAARAGALLPNTPGCCCSPWRLLLPAAAAAAVAGSGCMCGGRRAKQRPGASRGELLGKCRPRPASAPLEVGPRHRAAARNPRGAGERRQRGGARRRSRRLPGAAETRARGAPAGGGGSAPAGGGPAHRLLRATNPAAEARDRRDRHQGSLANGAPNGRRQLPIAFAAHSAAKAAAEPRGGARHPEHAILMAYNRADARARVGAAAGAPAKPPAGAREASTRHPPAARDRCRPPAEAHLDEAPRSWRDRRHTRCRRNLPRATAGAVRTRVCEICGQASQPSIRSR
jgi:hypothetical protein